MAIATTTALALAAMAAAGAQTYNTVQTAKKQDKQAAAGITAQAANQRRANAKITDTIDKVGANDASGARATAGKQYLDQVQASMGKANAGLARKHLNADFDQRAGGAAAANVDYGKQTADLMARMDAPVLQRQGEANLMGNTGMDLSALGSKIQGDAFLNNMAMNGIHRSPYIDFASQALSAYAGSAGGAPRGTGAANGNTGVVNPITNQMVWG